MRMQLPSSSEHPFLQSGRPAPRSCADGGKSSALGMGVSLLMGLSWSLSSLRLHVLISKMPIRGYI